MKKFLSAMMVFLLTFSLMGTPMASAKEKDLIVDFTVTGSTVKFDISSETCPNEYVALKIVSKDTNKIVYLTEKELENGKMSVSIKLGSGIYFGTVNSVIKNVAYQIPEFAIKTVKSVKLNTSSKALKKGEMFTLVATIYPDYAENKNVTWESSDNKVAVVNNGIVEGKNAGNATITVKTVDGGFSATCLVDVAIVSKLNITPLKAEINDGKSLQLKVEAAYTNGTVVDVTTDTAVKWNAQRGTIVNGLYTAPVNYGGDVKVTALFEGITGTATVTVKNLYVPTGNGGTPVVVPVVTPTPVLTPTPAVTPTPVPVATPTPVVIQAPVATPVPVVTATPIPEITPKPEVAPEPTPTPVVIVKDKTPASNVKQPVVKAKIKPVLIQAKNGINAKITKVVVANAIKGKKAIQIRTSAAVIEMPLSVLSKLPKKDFYVRIGTFSTKSIKFPTGSKIAGGSIDFKITDLKGALLKLSSSVTLQINLNKTANKNLVRLYNYNASTKKLALVKSKVSGTSIIASISNGRKSIVLQVKK